ncbi:hypothetical protein STCU_01609 [Strigomonas culicis]|uniref:MIP18 family-like domain-containing protein n=1 Tax=Strigomonas culicis TaxID=28005 RepID=S9V038_9TRYP|nr:hypothetical protein STCU_01609 [Strigomonas culicis]|eukprot:EPY34389.1 hypothetical protein STCU_01609 [Strigomonas culicis]
MDSFPFTILSLSLSFSRSSQTLALICRRFVNSLIVLVFCHSYPSLLLKEMTELSNPNPTVFASADAGHHRTAEELLREGDEDCEDPIDAWEVFELIRRIKDPEHPNTLEQLKVVEPSLIAVDWGKQQVQVRFTPTVPHCSMTTVIGLSIRLQLERTLPQYTKIDVSVTPGTHLQEEQVNKQLGDKERVAAALENNKSLLSMIESCIYAYEEGY